MQQWVPYSQLYLYYVDYIASYNVTYLLIVTSISQGEPLMIVPFEDITNYRINEEYKGIEVNETQVNLETTYFFCEHRQGDASF